MLPRRLTIAVVVWCLGCATTPEPARERRAPAPEVRCPAPREELALLIAGDDVPLWAKGLALKKCAPEPRPDCAVDSGLPQGDDAWVCQVSARGEGVCTADGRRVFSGEPDGHFMTYDEHGEWLRERWWVGGRQARSEIERGPGCMGERLDFDGDRFVDQVCTNLNANRNRVCAPFLRALDGVPCDGGCLSYFSRCVCDARGQLREGISDTSHARVVVRQESLDGGGALVETQYFLGSHATATHTAVRSDSGGRDLERVETTEAGTFITRTEWSDGGSSVQTTTLDGGQVRRMTRDLSVPGQRLERVETQAGVETWVSRSDANGQVTVMFDAPAELSWFTCAQDTECRSWADRCNCNALETVNVAFLAKLKGLRRAQCAASGGARPCPCAIGPQRQLVPVCRASLCTTRPR